jgi:hypothetical protein
MFTNPHFSAQLASDRQRDFLAEAEQHRRAAQFRSRPRTSRHVSLAGQGVRRVLRGMPVFRTVRPA